MMTCVLMMLLYTRLAGIRKC